ncbi:MAG: hypothetical protein LBK58_14280, partial [Prevotellaceae bacterium]|nr:hypothetical protein [Prevotellaceae bacterium]
MKKELVYLVFTALFFPLWACNSEETPFQEDGVKVEKGKIAFILPGVKTGVTYATTQGSGSENG